MKTLIVEKEALAEYREAASYYDADNPDVALRFVEQVEGIIESIHREPHLWPLDPTVPARLVAHGKRTPGYWRERLPPSTR